MTGLPEDVVAYSRSPEFTETTLPPALRRQHSTKAGTWALIHVLEGKVIYRIYNPASEKTLTPGTPGIVTPKQLHEVEPVGAMRMYVESYAVPKRE